MSMNMKAGLFQQQTLKMAMTQELMQAITLLQYSSQELSAFLEDKMVENPLLSLDRPTSSLFQPTFDRKRENGLLKIRMMPTIGLNRSVKIHYRLNSMSCPR